MEAQQTRQRACGGAPQRAKGDDMSSTGSSRQRHQAPEDEYVDWLAPETLVLGLVVFLVVVGAGVLGLVLAAAA